jgi:Zincin-like metallopeptidase
MCRCRPSRPSRTPNPNYATLAHECTHWTKHPERLNRDFGRKTWGDEGYSREELVAELGSAFLCADLELHQEPREDNAAYIANWLEVLKNDTRAIFAAAHAQRAADYLHRKVTPQANAARTPARAELAAGAGFSSYPPKRRPQSLFITEKYIFSPREARYISPSSGDVAERPRRRFAKPLYVVKTYRGFESLRLRHFLQYSYWLRAIGQTS